MFDEQPGIALFVGPKRALSAFASIGNLAHFYALTLDAGLFIVPATLPFRDLLHAANGTGEWFDVGSSGGKFTLTTSDMSFAIKSSAGSALAWIEAGRFGDERYQGAAVWIDGALAFGPASASLSDPRPRSLQPINSALRLLGAASQKATQGVDEFARFGLADYPSNDAIIQRAHKVMP